jgi:antirestriction protein ArdC
LDCQVRDDHSTYIASWLKVLKRDNKAVFSAASAAQKAVDYLISLQSTQEAQEPIEMKLAA